jgi:hypothetical protein
MSIPGGSNLLLLTSAAGGGGGGYEISRSLRFNSSDSAYLSRAFDNTADNQKHTFSFWFKLSNLPSANENFFGAWVDDSYQTNCWISTTGAFNFYQDGQQAGPTGTSTLSFYGTQVLRDYSAWYHVVISIDRTQSTSTDRFKVYLNGVDITANGSTSYGDQNSVARWPGSSTSDVNIGRFRSGEPLYYNGYLADFYFIDGQALDPSSFGEFDTNGVWQPKAYAGTYGTNGFHLPFSDNSTAAALGTDTSGNGNTWTVNNLSVPVTSVTNPVWYASPNLYTTKADVLANATNKGTGSWGASNEYVYLVVNSGGNIGSSNVFGGNFPTTFYPYSNVGGTFTREGSYGATELSSFGWAATNSALYKIANDRDFYILSDTDANPPTGGSLSGTIPALTTSSFRTLAGINAAADSFVDSPTNYGTDTGAGGEVRGNYATLNPLNTQISGSSVLQNGNLTLNSTSGTYVNSKSTLSASAFNNYSEMSITTQSNSNGLIGIGVGNAIANIATGDGSYTTYRENGEIFVYPGGSLAGTVASYTQGDVIGMTISSTQVSFYKNNILQGTYSHNLTGDFFVVGMTYNNGGTAVVDFNFGQRPFAYTAPSGFKALCTTNLPEPTIADGSTAMDVALYTGNGSTQTISGLNFSPDFAWLKIRSNVGSHFLFDTVRGATNELRSNSTNAENSLAQSLTAFNSDGFSLGTDNAVNGSSDTYVAWTWDAGSSTVSNTEGSISSQVRANASAGFSVVTFTSPSSGTFTVGHGLGVSPSLIILKDRGQPSSWSVYHSTVTSKDEYLLLNTTAAKGSNTNYWGTTAPSSTVFGANAGVSVQPSDPCVAYCWTPVDGYSSAFSYSGNGSSDGPYTYLGFRSRFIIIKRTDTNRRLVNLRYSA